MSVFQSQQPNLDLDKARALGVRLKEARQKQQLSLHEVADILLLSRAQIEGLEAGNGGCFYGARLYAQSAEKYAARIGLADVVPGELLIEAVQLTEIAAVASAKIAGVDLPTTTTPASSSVPEKRRAASPLLILIILAGLGIAVYAFNLFSPAAPTLPPASSAHENHQTTTGSVPNPAPVAAVAEDKVASVTHAGAVSPVAATASSASPVASGTIALHFSGDSWVQVVEANGSKRDRIYRKGDTLTLETATLQGLIIGNAEVVRAVSAKGDVDLTPYINRGGKVARVIGPAVRTFGH